MIAVLPASFLVFGMAFAQQSLSIATGGTGGFRYPTGGVCAEIVEDDGDTAAAEVTGASIENSGLNPCCDGDIAPAPAASARTAHCRSSRPCAPWAPAVSTEGEELENHLSASEVIPQDTIPAGSYPGVDESTSTTSPPCTPRRTTPRRSWRCRPRRSRCARSPCSTTRNQGYEVPERLLPPQ